MTKPTLIGISRTPEHYNPNSGCTIPATWVAYVETGERLSPLGGNYVRQLRAEKRSVIGEPGELVLRPSTRAQALQLARDEFPGLR